MAREYHLEPISNVAVAIAYDGGDFYGYARQNVLRSVQGSFEEALATLADGPFKTAVAGRTDRGVHALSQVVSASFAQEQKFDLAKVQRSLDRLTPRSISIISVKEAPAEFHARFSAVARRYRYLISSAPLELPHDRRISWNLGASIDVSALVSASAILVGEHDFSTFCRRDPNAGSLIRLVNEVAIVKAGRNLFGFEIDANAFCHQMVRSLVGFLALVATGRRDPADFGKALRAKDRSTGENLAPPEGLFLTAVRYREPFINLNVIDDMDYPVLWKSRHPEIG